MESIFQRARHLHALNQNNGDAEQESEQNAERNQRDRCDLLHRDLDPQKR